MKKFQSIVVFFFLLNVKLFSFEYYTVDVLSQIPRNGNHFTQGLYYKNHTLYESNGVEGFSSLIKMNSETGEIINKLNQPKHFREGIASINERLYQLTWQSRIGFIYDENSFHVIDTFFYHTEGWGLTTDSVHFILSDGSHHLYLIEPDGFKVIDTISVYYHQTPLTQLNELEYVNGFVYANIYMTDMIAVISLADRELTGLIDASPLRKLLSKQPPNVLNGIAYNSDEDLFYLTGKYWPVIFKVKFMNIHH